jgi:hypothetical protein
LGRKAEEGASRFCWWVTGILVWETIRKWCRLLKNVILYMDTRKLPAVEGA